MPVFIIALLLTCCAPLEKMGAHETTNDTAVESWATEASRTPVAMPPPPICRDLPDACPVCIEGFANYMLLSRAIWYERPMPGAVDPQLELIDAQERSYFQLLDETESCADVKLAVDEVVAARMHWFVYGSGFEEEITVQSRLIYF